MKKQNLFLLIPFLLLTNGCSFSSYYNYPKDNYLKNRANNNLTNEFRDYSKYPNKIIDTKSDKVKNEYPIKKDIDYLVKNEMDTIINSKDITLKTDAAMNKNLSCNDLLKLSEDDNFNVQETSLKNPNLYQDVFNSNDLDILSSSKYYKLRELVAQNKNTSAKTLLKLSEDINYNVQEASLKNPNLYQDIFNSNDLDILSSSKYYKLRELVAQNKNTSAKTLLKLSEDINYTVQTSVLKNPKLYQNFTSEKDLELLSKSKNADIRNLVAKHLNTTKDILLILTKDESYSVRTTAQFYIKNKKE
ncbi:MAG: hypothetical protein U0457_01025 [Candidatus Sericytochromatia bacterium]